MKTIEYKLSDEFVSKIGIISDIFESEEIETVFSTSPRSSSNHIECSVVNNTYSNELVQEFIKLKNQNMMRQDPDWDRVTREVNSIGIIKRINILTDLFIVDFSYRYDFVSWSVPDKISHLVLEFKDLNK